MIRLIIDTSSNKLYLGLFRDLITIRESTLSTDDISSICVERISKLLDSVQLNVDDIDEFIVGIGPGSFTGLRVGLTIAKIFTQDDVSRLFTINSLYLFGSGVTHARIYSEARNDNCYGLITTNYIPGIHGFFKTEEFIKTEKNQALIKVPSNDFVVQISNVLKQREQVKDYFSVPDYWKVPDVLVKVDFMKDEDYPKFLDIWTSSKIGISEITFEDYQVKKVQHSMVGLYLDKVLSGFIFAKEIKGDGYQIFNIYVLPDARNHLGGTKLFTFMLDYLKGITNKVTFLTNRFNEILQKIIAKTDMKYIEFKAGNHCYEWSKDVSTID